MTLPPILPLETVRNENEPSLLLPPRRAGGSILRHHRTGGPSVRRSPRRGLPGDPADRAGGTGAGHRHDRLQRPGEGVQSGDGPSLQPADQDRKSVVSGKSVSVGLDLGGGRKIKN